MRENSTQCIYVNIGIPEYASLLSGQGTIQAHVVVQIIGNSGRVGVSFSDLETADRQQSPEGWPMTLHSDIGLGIQL